MPEITEIKDHHLKETLKKSCEAFFEFFTQRSTLIGFLLTTITLFAVYYNLIDDDQAVTVLIFASGLLIPENSRFARQAIQFIAPLLVKSIEIHSPHHLSPSEPKLYEQKAIKEHHHPF